MQSHTWKESCIYLFTLPTFVQLAKTAKIRRQVEAFVTFYKVVPAVHVRVPVLWRPPGQTECFVEGW